MNKQELLKMIDRELLEKLYGFCYARTSDSYEAQELCSDIVFALIKASGTEGTIAQFYPFVWGVARNVYANFSNRRKRHGELFYEGNGEEILPFLADPEEEDNSDLLRAVYHRISFLTKAYREVMILFYIDGLSTREIAQQQGTSEGAIRQRLFSARNKIRNEVTEMTEAYQKPISLDQIDYILWGTGNPAWGDPRTVCTRQFSKHVVWVCRRKPMSAREIAEELHVPTGYVEEELELLTKGENGQYGLLRQLENGRYTLNFILFDRDEIKSAHEIYQAQLPDICSIICEYVEKHKEEYLAFPYLNKKIDMNLVLWQQIFTLAASFSDHVERILSEKYFAQTDKKDRPFSVFGYVDNGVHYGGGWDGADAANVCGYSRVHLDNIYIARIKKHFGCGLNVANDAQIQLALRAIHGLAVHTLSEIEKEHAAKAIACGYLYREGDMLYTKILVHDMKDTDRLFLLSNKLSRGYFEDQAEITAKKISELIRNTVPEYLLGEWRFANILANLPVLDLLVEALIEQGLLVPPGDGIGAEGCWMAVEK